ncbi:MAG: hypothetical protein ACKVY0_23920 [Prosthecobacter sp.]|uniref:hypothetical protein n=1 Tax=Prosthecobacter sp. TaxID=1965333 RepID=UPI003902860E
MLLTVFCAGLGIAQAQSLTRAETKKPLSEAVEKVLAEFVGKCAPEKQKQLTAHMEEVIKAVDEVAKLSPEETTALKNAAAKAVEAALKTWEPQAIVMMRTYLSRTSDAAAIRHIGVWKPENAGPGEPIEDWNPPNEDAAWVAVLKTTLGEARFATWNEADAKVKKQADEEIAAYLERWVRESRGPMNEDLQAKIALMKKSLQLSEANVAALNKEAEALLNRLCAAEQKRATSMLRTMSPEARQKKTGSSSFYIRFDRPRGEAWNKAWDDTAAKVLAAEQIAIWQKADQEQRTKDETELADMIKPSEQQAETQMEQALTAEIDSITVALSLSKERQKELEKLSKAAIQESLKLARKGWLQQAKNYSTTERKRIRGNVYFGINEEQTATALPIWKDGLKKLLSEEERTRMAAENKQREERTSGAIARACLAEMDKTLVLNADQRTKLEPLLRELMQPLMEQRRQQYWSYNATQLFQAAGKVKEEMLGAILDDVQKKHWKELVTSNSSSSRNVVIPDMNSNGPEVPDMEAAIAAHLYKMFVAERKRVLGAMMPLVEDATRVLTLPAPDVARLTTAAKGAAEQNLSSWRQTLERYVRSSVQTATAKNILQALAGTERVNFSRNEGEAQEAAVWKEALSTTLNEAQQKQLKQVVDARRDYRLKAMAAMSTSELDRRRRLTAEQCVKIEASIHKVLAEYLPDIERYMSFQWFLQYYYALVPLGGVPDKEMQAILTPEQWKLCKERDLPDAMQYWEGIKQNHEQRAKQGANGNANRIIFNGGIMLDQ